MVIADSSVWIHYLRTPDTPVGRKLASLLAEDKVALTGVVLAEVIQGARTTDDFAKLHSLLEVLPYLESNKRTWLKAGELAMQLRGEGRLIPLTDLVIAGVALEEDHEVFTLDEHFQRIPGLKLHEVSLGLA